MRREVNSQMWRDELARSTQRPDAFHALTSQTLDGISISPLYSQAKRNYAFSRPKTTALRQTIAEHDWARARAKVATDLAAGVTHFRLLHPSSPSAFAEGFNAIEATDLAAVFNDRRNAILDIRLDGGCETLSLMEPLRRFCRARKSPLNPVILHGGFSPTQALAMGREHEPDAIRRYADHFREGLEEGWSGAFFVADTRLYHGAGASEAQTLGLLLAEWRSRMEEADTLGLDFAVLFAKGLSLLQLDADFWMGAAKIEAARRLIAAFQRHLGLENSRAPAIEVEFAPRALTRNAPINNLVRISIATASALLSRVDTVTTVPHPLALGTPNARAHKLSRSLVEVLREEGHLNRVDNAFDGSGYVENLASALAERAWDYFRQIEREGALAQRISDGTLANELALMRRKRENGSMRGDAPVLGERQFAPQHHEKAQDDVVMTRARPTCDNPFDLRPLEREDHYPKASGETNSQKEERVDEA